jgi:hypothetical protein
MLMGDVEVSTGSSNWVKSYAMAKQYTVHLSIMETAQLSSFTPELNIVRPSCVLGRVEAGLKKEQFMLGDSEMANSKEEDMY